MYKDCPDISVWKKKKKRSSGALGLCLFFCETEGLGMLLDDEFTFGL